MRTAALILGILGGVFGLFGAGAALTIGGVGGAVGAENAGTVIGGGTAALILSVLGIIGGALALAKPKLAGWLMLISGIGGIIAIFVLYLVPGALLLVGGILALAARKASVEKPGALKEA